MKANNVFSVATLAALLSPLSALADDTPFVLTCNVIEVSVLENRSHIFCSSGWYFAVPNSSSSEAARLIALGTSALESGKALFVSVPFKDPSTEAWGCETYNCRRPIKVTLRK